MTDEEETSGVDVAEVIRLVIVWGLLAVNVWILWDGVKERPDVLVLRARVREAVAGPWNRYREMRRAEKHVVFEAMEVVDQPQKEGQA